MKTVVWGIDITWSVSLINVIPALKALSNPSDYLYEVINDSSAERPALMPSGPEELCESREGSIWLRERPEEIVRLL